VQKFAVDLLDHTRTSKELEVMLNYNPDDPFESEEGEKMGLDRLKLAIDYKQKDVSQNSIITC
jgi:transient receptor potential cation channel subfamily C